MRWIIFIMALFIGTTLWSQGVKLKGRVVDQRNGQGLEGVALQLQGIPVKVLSDMEGNFAFARIAAGNYLLLMKYPGYHIKRMPIQIGHADLELGPIYLEEEISHEQGEAGIQISGAGEDEGPGFSSSRIILQAGRDIFLNRAAFDFGQVFFKPRGYDPRHTQVLINGFSMNSLYDGRPQWHQWGGLNDMFRNQVVAYGLKYSENTFGRTLGSIVINSRPSALRPGIRVSGSATNRSYRERLMCSYVSEPLNSGFGMAFSASRRWARNGFIDGRLYDSWSGYASFEYHFNPEHSLSFTAFSAYNRRGLSPALVTEITSLLGTSYNPYWGHQDGRIRNSRELRVYQPAFQINYQIEGEKAFLQLGAAYQLGSRAQSRLGYFDAPNPDPVYYRYLPSYAINNPGGANFESARLARESLLKSPQLDWQALYQANVSALSAGKASYLLYEDVADQRRLQLQARASLDWGEHMQLNTGLGYTCLISDNFARIKDMLGATYHDDRDPFSGSRNDLGGELKKTMGEHFGYDYQVTAKVLQPYFQFRFNAKNWLAFVGGRHRVTSYSRLGRYQNERYPDGSLGSGQEIVFTDWLFKGGMAYNSGAKHWWSLNGSMGKLPVPWKYTWINPRDSEEQVPDISSEKLFALDFNYDLRLRTLKGRISAFYTRIMDKTDIHFFYVDAGVGSDFVQEVLTGLDELNMGVEVGLQQELSNNVNASLVLGLGKYLYASDPQVAINFDTAGLEEELINTAGTVALGAARLKDYHIASGPQKALSLGIDYHHPDYWWIGLTANYLWANYVHPSAIARTDSFSLDPLSGDRFEEADKEQLDQLLQQESLDEVYLLNLTAGKSWLRKGLYISLFASISNIFDTRYRSGGYEQSRNGNFGQWRQDQLGGNPSFGPKYWYGQGRGYFLNLAVGF